MNPLKCMIVDDEPLAIRLIESFIARTPFLQLTDKHMNPLQALAALTPDIQLLFLDIQIPGLTGLELSRLVSPDTRIIFTTAFKEYAFDSYEVQALDYLLKPINYTAFLKAVTKGKIYFEQKAAPTVATEQDPLQPEKGKPKETENKLQPFQTNYIFVKSEYKLVRVDFDKILYISGLKDYARIYLSDSSRPLIALITLKSLTDKLPADRFCRVHRSYIVALDKIENIERNRIKIGKELIPVSDIHLETLMEKINL